MSDKTSIGDRQKLYEGIEADRILIPRLPILIRLDGKAFHTFTRGFKRPYDERMVRAMQNTTRHLIEQTNAVVGYTQSDEISLCLYNKDFRTETYFGGRVQKLNSVITSMCTAFFNKQVTIQFNNEIEDSALFDCRVWNAPDLTEATNHFLWREFDATKNAISMAAQHYFSHDTLQNKNGKEMQEMLFSTHNINFNDYPDFFKRGTYFRKVIRSTPFTTEEIESLPPKHSARLNPGLIITRSVIEPLKLEPLNRISNPVDVLFNYATPQLLNKEEAE